MAKKLAKVRVIRDFIIVKPCDESTHNKGAIWVPDNAKDPHNPECGIVLGVGCGLVEGGQIIPLKVKAGDHIRFPRNSGTLCQDDPDWKQTVFVLRENQVFWAAGSED